MSSTTKPINPAVRQAVYLMITGKPEPLPPTLDQAASVNLVQVPIIAQEVIAWIESEFYIPETNAPLVLEQYQKTVLLEALRIDPATGKFIYDLVLWSDIKKSIKSTIAAAICLHRALHRSWSSVKIIANDLKQAESRVFDYIERALILNPRLKPRYRKHGYTFTFDNHSKIEAVPIDPGGEAGGNDDLIEFTELHAANSKAQAAMWSEMTVPPNKHGYSQRWIDTYAGHTGESATLERLYEQCVKPENLVQLPNAPAGLETYVNGAMFCLWNSTPRMLWQTPAYYASEAATLTDTEFSRMHRNQWGTSENTFIPYAWWEGCKSIPLPTMDKYLEMAVGIDAAISGDCFGIVAVSRHKDKVAVRYVRKWTPPKGGKLTYGNIDNPDDQDYPEGVIRWLAKTYNVIVYKYDPYQLHDLCTRLGDANIGLFEAMAQGAPRLIADKQLYDMIRDRRVLHDDNVDLNEHIRNSNRKEEADNRLRIIKRADSMKIDLAVSMSMAVSGAMELLSE